jgi:hypothetical protein
LSGIRLGAVGWRWQAKNCIPGMSLHIEAIELRSNAVRIGEA